VSIRTAKQSFDPESAKKILTNVVRAAKRKKIAKKIAQTKKAYFKASTNTKRAGKNRNSIKSAPKASLNPTASISLFVQYPSPNSILKKAEATH
jgi:chorismate mutase